MAYSVVVMRSSLKAERMPLVDDAVVGVGGLVAKAVVGEFRLQPARSSLTEFEDGAERRVG